ncbi:hypothetical protein HOK021_65230 [Streptomyces hygroscopicus]|nr:hypothetical protein HOK021_65230 [Streptomyces hygroscopicus]
MLTVWTERGQWFVLLEARPVGVSVRVCHRGDLAALDAHVAVSLRRFNGE